MENNRLYYAKIKGRSSTEYLFEVFFSRDNKEIISKCKEYIYKMQIINDDNLSITISEISCSKLVFKNYNSLYNYFINIINNHHDNIYDELLSIIDCNRIYYDINFNIINHSTHYQVPDIGELCTNEKFFTESDCKNGMYIGEFKYLEPIILSDDESKIINPEKVSKLYFPYVFIKYNNKIYASSTYNNSIEDAINSCNDFVFTFIDDELGEEYSNEKLNELINICEKFIVKIYQIDMYQPTYYTIINVQYKETLI